MIFLNIFQWILFAVLGFFLGYQTILTLLALNSKKIKNFSTIKDRRFAIVVPAYNEEKVILKTLYSLFSIIYPKKLYDVIVIADNCTDNTAKIARNLGATVLERQNPDERGKGYALKWGFHQTLNSGQDYDAIVVFDSDSLVSGNFLEVMNYYLENGSKAIQSSDLVIPQPGVWSSEATRIGFLLCNYVRPLGRKVLGFNMGLRGNGMCFSTSHLKKHPWQALSLTEDLEYGLMLLSKGVNIDFAPEAFVWAQMPIHAVNAESQRKRWEMGRYEVMRKYTHLFFRKIVRERSLKYLDILFDLTTPPFVNMLLAISLMIIVNALFWYIELTDINLLIMWSILAIVGFFQLLAGLVIAGADKQLYKSLFYIPVYILWKIKVYIKTLFIGKEEGWIRTTRDS